MGERLLNQAQPRLGPGTDRVPRPFRISANLSRVLPGLPRSTRSCGVFLPILDSRAAAPNCGGERPDTLLIVETMMQQSCDFPGTPQFNFEEWTDVWRPICGGVHGVAEPNAFAGWMRQLSVCGVPAAAIKIQCGLGAVDHGTNLYRYERTHRAVRVAEVDWYTALFQVTGRSALTQADHAIQLGAGDIGLLDGARASTRLSENCAQWLSIYLPRQSVISRLGYEPQACLRSSGETLAGRVLRQLVLESIEDDDTAARSDPHMQLALYDLIGALFAPPDPWIGSRYSDTLFRRIRGIIEDGFADPNFGPTEVAAETGISLRYLQKLFTERGLTCSEFIYGRRLDHAARLVHRRASLGTNQPLSEIAYACGFRDYTHFARKFRHRFGHAPGAHSDEIDGAGNGVVRATTGESAPSAHDARPSAV
jgi:AraC family transcriptional activator of tynA and feaB